MRKQKPGKNVWLLTGCNKISCQGVIIHTFSCQALPYPDLFPDFADEIAKLIHSGGGICGWSVPYLLTPCAVSIVCLYHIADMCAGTVRYERKADFRSLRKLPFREVAVHKSPVKEGMVAHSINFASIFSQTGRYRLPISFVGWGPLK